MDCLCDWTNTPGAQLKAAIEQHFQREPDSDNLQERYHNFRTYAIIIERARRGMLDVTALVVHNRTIFLCSLDDHCSGPSIKEKHHLAEKLTYCTVCLGNDIYCFDKGLMCEILTTARTWFENQESLLIRFLFPTYIIIEHNSDKNLIKSHVDNLHVSLLPYKESLLRGLFYLWVQKFWD